MKWTEYKERFKTTLYKTSEKQKMEFALEICEKLLPDYHTFTDETKWGDSDIISEALDLAKKCANTQQTRADLIKKMVGEVEKNTPDMDDFGQVSGSLALNSCTAISETLNFILDKKTERIIDIGSFSYDSTYFKVGELNPKLSDLEIEKHSDLQNEMEWQLEKIKYVA
ncbi:DUF416 family protein [Croceitalea marina]|uniref:DUF416 family protein n=1 Tax=Croceitalea marina TaxID=1775166 RepID=A0ABW5MZG2_9FLAO